MTLHTAIQYLKIFYSHTTKDKISLQEIYAAAGKNLAEPERNRVWLGNKLIYMKRHGLVEPKYDKKGNSNILVEIALTEQGKEVLGRIANHPSKQETMFTQNPIEKNRVQHLLSLEEIMKAMPRLRQQNPDFEITFDVRLKNG